jgi:peroxiredoxin
MKSKTILLLVIVIGIAAAFFTLKPAQSPQTPGVGTPVQDFELTDSNQNRINLSSMKGSVVFVNFWATWCASCIDEMPSIERMHRTLSANQSFKFVSILYKDDLNRATRFMQQNGFTFPVYLNQDESAARMFGITGIPETFIIDKRGMLRHKVIGPAEWDSPRALDMLQTLLNES